MKVIRVRVDKIRIKACFVVIDVKYCGAGFGDDICGGRKILFEFR